MRIKKECRVHIWAVLLLVIFYSCSRIGFDLPQGPQGASGKSAYEIWKEEVVGGRINWPRTVQRLPISWHILEFISNN